MTVTEGALLRVARSVERLHKAAQLASGGALDAVAETKADGTIDLFFVGVEGEHDGEVIRDLGIVKRTEIDKISVALEAVAGCRS